MARLKNPHIGSNFDDFLKQGGVLEEVENDAIKRVLAWQLEQAMSGQHLTKTAMARQMGTSRSQLDRLLDPSNDSVTLATLMKAAQVLGRKLRLELA